MRRFRLRRDHDVTGVSGEGVVAEGVLLDSNVAVVTWLGPMPSFVLWPDFAHAVRVHGHGGHTRFVWLGDVEPEPAARVEALAETALAGLQAWFRDNPATEADREG